MKLKKTGFTLAEILISLTIIGVVAALSAPPLIQNATNARTGPALEKTRAAIELANQNILFRARATDLLAITGNNNDGQAAAAQYLQQLAQNFQNSTFIPAAEDDDENPIGAFSFTGRNDVIPGTREWDGTPSVANNATPKLILSDNATLSVNADNPNPPYTNFNADGANGNLGQRGSYRGPLANLLVDLNGVSNGPNMYGRDIFFFTVDRSGVVIPDGSDLFNEYISWPNNNPGTNTWHDAGQTYQCNEGGVTTGRGCAGSILDDARRRVNYR